MTTTPPIKDRLPVGVGVALVAAALFGVSTPFAKLLLGTLSPVLTAGLLYLGSGLGLIALWLAGRKSDETGLRRADLKWVVGSTVFGGVLGPVLLMIGLRVTPASTASLLINLEAVFTALLAWFVFHEKFDRRIALGIGLIVGGGIVLSWQGAHGLTFPLGSMAIAGGCLCWGIDNNLMQKISGSNPIQIAAIKGIAAGGINLGLALLMGERLPSTSFIAGGLLVGFVGYGLSLACFVMALRHIGTARTGGYFALAPFVAATVSLLMLHETVSPRLLVAALIMGAGVGLQLTEQHSSR